MISSINDSKGRMCGNQGGRECTSRGQIWKGLKKKGFSWDIFPMAVRVDM